MNTCEVCATTVNFNQIIGRAKSVKYDKDVEMAIEATKEYQNKKTGKPYAFDVHVLPQRFGKLCRTDVAQ